jgi:hypothetical protein
MTTRAFFLSLVVVSVGACERSPSSGTQNQAPTPAPAALQPLVLAQTSLLPGTTAVDPGRAAVMFVSNANPPALAKVMAAVDSYFKLTDAAGAEVSVHAVTLPSKTSTFNTVVEISPGAQLRPDEWYTLSVQQGADLQVSNDRAIEEVAARPVGVWTIPFFTGSAPHVRALEVPVGAKDGSYVRVHFSEPVRLEDIDSARILTAGGRAYGKCVLLGGACATSLNDTLAEVVDISPAGRLSDMSGPLAVNLGRTIRGSGRTVGEGVDAARLLARGSTLQGREVSREIATASLRSCNDGASRCWSAAAHM